MAHLYSAHYPFYCLFKYFFDVALECICTWRLDWGEGGIKVIMPPGGGDGKCDINDNKIKTIKITRKQNKYLRIIKIICLTFPNNCILGLRRRRVI